ncbi:FadR/GntR family transcriptional regulator [Fusibacter ferrireducens]|uniref:FadR family transcriptional regulator n=1 Tax=Fusibacter ferrireducens TaxID=2785058 RepID=A0ABR9ZSC7_9FIRM|nr:FadR/GntR family transcriptional regulator [Fusibacter ferrireducens]MBF4693368.1 FadR family transcriptional regulator [Fusibacter ferrireducens]
MFQPVKTKKIYEMIIEQIQEMILSGALKTGDKLPSERILAEQFNASRASIREAIRSLEILGVVESRQGGGNFISDYKSANWIEPISLMFKLGGGNFDEILEMRTVIEVEAARLAAIRITEDQKQNLIHLEQRLKAATSEEELSSLDQQFHIIVAEASHNVLIETMMRAIQAILKNFIGEARQSINTWAQDSGVLLTQHLKIAESILQGKSEEAALNMKAHFVMVVKSRSKA